MTEVAHVFFIHFSNSGENYFYFVFLEVFFIDFSHIFRNSSRFFSFFPKISNKTNENIALNFIYHKKNIHCFQSVIGENSVKIQHCECADGVTWSIECNSDEFLTIND